MQERKRKGSDATGSCETILFLPILSNLIRLTSDFQEPTQLDLIYPDDRIIPFSSVITAACLYRPTLHLSLEWSPYTASPRKACRMRPSCVAHDQRGLRLKRPGLAESLKEIVFIIWRGIEFV
jgi:hypothetical protein